jgi:hypothetical protein
MLTALRSHLQYKLMLAFSLVLLIALAISTGSSQLSARALLLGRARVDQLRLVGARVSAAESLVAEIRTDLLYLARDVSAAEDWPAGDIGLGGERARSLLLGFLSSSSRRYAGLCLSDRAGGRLSCVQARNGRLDMVPSPIRDDDSSGTAGRALSQQSVRVEGASRGSPSCRPRSPAGRRPPFCATAPSYATARGPTPARSSSTSPPSRSSTCWPTPQARRRPC